MYYFKLANGKYVDHVFLDGYEFGDFLLTDIMISVYLDENGNTITKLNDKDLFLEEHILNGYLKKAQQVAEEYIRTCDLGFFQNKFNQPVVDIVDNKKQSFYHKNIPPIKEILHLKISPISSDSILEFIETKKFPIYIQ